MHLAREYMAIDALMSLLKLGCNQLAVIKIDNACPMGALMFIEADWKI